MSSDPVQFGAGSDRGGDRDARPDQHVGRGRLGIYVDTVYYVSSDADGVRVSADPIDAAFLLFAREVGKGFDGVVVFGRALRGDASPSEYVPLSGVEVVELPHYESLRELRTLLRVARGTTLGFWRGLGRVETIWIYGPHPFGLLLLLLALVRRTRIVLGVRQDTIPYYRARLPSARWKPFLLPVWVLDAAYKFLARRLKTTVVGSEIARRYGRDRPSVLPMTVSLIRAAEVVTEPSSRDWHGRIELLAVGRLEPEKNPLLLVEALAQLERDRPGRYRLTWLGQGRLRDTVQARAEALGVANIVELRGFVPYGPELLSFYRCAHLFVHVSLTEAVPQVLLEALACGTPVVATDVGDIAAILDDGGAGILVPPRNAGAFAAAVTQATDDAELRTRLVRRGLELARARTLEAEAARVARFIASDS
jgi:glycosyltransferase involved in cell wall biosynthesis